VVCRRISLHEGPRRSTTATKTSSPSSANTIGTYAIVQALKQGHLQAVGIPG
jgi:hypothetical protein